MLMMRLQRIGRRNEAHFKIVVIEKTKGPKSQRYVDIIGSYNPKLGQVTIDKEKAAKWLGNGVQPSDTVQNFLIDQGLVEGRKKNVLPKKSPTKKKNAPEVEETPEPAEEVKEEAPAAEVVEEAPTEESKEEVAEEPAAEEAPAEEATPEVEETPEPVVEETKEEVVVEETTEEAVVEDTEKAE